VFSAFRISNEAFFTRCHVRVAIGARLKAPSTTPSLETRPVKDRPTLGAIAPSGSAASLLRLNLKLRYFVAKSPNLNKPPSPTIFKATWILAICAMSSAAISYSVTHWAFPPVGYEGMLVLAGLMIWAGILCIAGAIVLSGVILVKRRGFPVAWPLICCAAAGLLMFMAVR
jgi:hypothetical protein